MPSHAGYEPIAGTEEEAVLRTSLDSQDDSAPAPGGRGKRRGPGVDLKGIDTAFKRWTETIAQKVKINRRKRLEVQPEKREVAFSVFQQAYGKLPPPPQKTLDHQKPITHEEFELPYSMRNPKFQKWVHRTFFWWIGFGRSCLIPNLSYISEAGASLLDTRLGLNIVPHTELASFASPAFFYDWIDRSGAKKGKALPEKIGSLQLFAHGFTDASDFLRKHPWPGRSITDTWNEDDHRQGRTSKRCFNACGVLCGKAGGDFDDYDDLDYEQIVDAPEDHTRTGGSFAWTLALQQSFREELEKLIILDYLMRNTDRGLDNFMIKYCEGTHEKQVVDTAPTRLPMMSELKNSNMQPPATSHMSTSTPSNGEPSGSSQYKRPHVHIAAIDNSLSFPHQHPKGWRSYTYGWLFLPVSLIGRPFSENTRNHFLPLLSSPEWWAETIFQLRKLFALDPDFNQRMFDRQMAVLKGQGWNIVQSLKREEEGPLELTRRIKVLVWDEEVEVVNETVTDTDDSQAIPTPSRPRPNSLAQTPQASRKTISPIFHLPRRQRSRSISDFPPPRPRAPVPFSRAIGTTNAGTSGVAALAQLERLDEVSGGKDDAVAAEEAGVATTEVFSPTEAPPRNSRGESAGNRPGPSRVSPVPEHDESDTTPPPPPPEITRVASDSVVLDDEFDGEDDGSDPVMFGSVTSLGDHTPIPPSMTRSATAAQTRPAFGHKRWPSYEGGSGKKGQRLSLDTATASDVVSGKTRTVIRERLQTVDSKAFFKNW
ncbi:phosphatidyl inositol kinase [Ceratobasidium sp. 370]|nr:phosphatidyl inositol kinase [Ceratobasidium sp. 370]